MGESNTEQLLASYSDSTSESVGLFEDSPCEEWLDEG